MRKIWLTCLIATASTVSSAQPAPRETAGTVALLHGRVTLTLHTCANNGANIQCDFTLKSLIPAASDYKYDSLLSTSRMLDDTHIEHAQITGYFVVGNGKPADSITLVRDETVTVIQIFGGADPQIKRVNVLFGNEYFSTTLK